MPALIFVVLVAGAVGLFLAAPGGRRALDRAGTVLLLCAAVGVGVWLGRQAGLSATSITFIGCSLVSLFAAVRVITHRRPVYSALYFVLLVVAVAGLLVLMQAEFLAAALLIIYAGAILVTYIFVIMLAQQSREAPYDARAREPLLGTLAGVVLVAVIAGQLANAGGSGPAESAALEVGRGTVERVGTSLLTQYIVGVQLAGLLLLVAMVGAIAIARRRAAQVTGMEVPD